VKRNFDGSRNVVRRTGGDEHHDDEGKRPKYRRWSVVGRSWNRRHYYNKIHDSMLYLAGICCCDFRVMCGRIVSDASKRMEVIESARVILRFGEPGRRGRCRTSGVQINVIKPIRCVLV
jgi:hypothetical protein